MAFLFAEICTLLDRLELLESHAPLHLPEVRKAKLKDVTDSWFKSHRAAIEKLSIEGAAALLSALLPERRTDRVYGIQTAGLCRILCRCLHLKASHVNDLRNYAKPGQGDLGMCVERVLRDGGGPPAEPAVSLEHVDDLLTSLAGHSRSSDPTVPRNPPDSSGTRDQRLARVFLRLQPEHAKWLTRIILKDFAPVRVDEGLVLRSFHFLFPDLLRFQQNFYSAISLLRGPLIEYHEHPDPRSQRLLRQQAASLIKPRVGVKVGRPAFHKARSIDHCMKMMGLQEWVLERKYDGEYCEVHVDMSKSPDPYQCLQIFAKSGKDSTADRRGIHETLVKCLRLGQPCCKIKRQAILLGELVVWSDKEQEVARFEEIRKHVTRSGGFIGTDAGSQKHRDEHLAIVFFDLLLLDDEVVMSKPITERRNRLNRSYTKIKGRAIGAEWRTIDFREKRSRELLLQQFAASVARRCEGLVLKPCDVPYFPLTRDYEGSTDGFVKLKKDYIADCGDEADFAVVGASYNAQQAARSCLKNIKYTDFHLGTLLNKSDVQRYGVKPVFKVVGTIQQEDCIPKAVLQTANILGALSATEITDGMHKSIFDLEALPTCKIDHVFTTPLIFEVLGSGFEKPSNADYFMLRHARVKKLHQDRSWKDCISFRELQDEARATRESPVDCESRETRRWIAKLEGKHRRKFEREDTATPRTCTTVTPLSARSANSKLSSMRKQSHNPPARTAMSEVSVNGLQARQEPVRLIADNFSASDSSTLLERSVSSSSKRRRAGTTSTSSPESKRSRSEPAERRPLVGSADVKAATAATGHHHTAVDDVACHDICKATSRGASIPGKFAELLRPIVARTSQPAVKSVRKLPKQYPASSCLFSTAVVYLAPCIAQTSYIQSDLLAKHAVLSTPSLDHWARQTQTHAPLSSTVVESQSYPGCKKIVLVEGRRVQAVRAIVAVVEGLNLRERVEVWDWRILEHASDHTGQDEETMHGSFVGATIWDGDVTVFVWSKSMV